MAFYDEKDKDQQAAMGNEVKQGPQGSGVISGQGAPGAASAPGQGAKTPDNPGNFVGIQNYLKQNQSQGKQLAENVGGFVKSQGQEAVNQLGQAQNKFGQEAEAGTVKYNQELANKAAFDPTAVAGNAQQLQQFQQMRDAQYKGPKSLQDTEYFQKANEQAQKAQQAAQNTGSVEGRSALINEVQKANKLGTNRGIASLDNAILGTAKEAKDILGAAKSDVTKNVGTAATEAERIAAAKAAEAQSETERTKKLIQDAFGGSTAALEKQLQERVAAETARGKQITGAAQQALSSGGALDEQVLADLGIGADEYQRLAAQQALANKYGQGFNLSQFATFRNPEAELTAQNLATPEEVAKYQALNQLMGTSGGLLSDPSVAGKANKDFIDFKGGEAKGQLANALKSSRDKAEEAFYSKYGRKYDLSAPREFNNEKKAAWDALQNEFAQFGLEPNNLVGPGITRLK